MLEDDWRRKFNVKTQRCSQDFFLPRRKKLRPEVRGSQGRERRGFLGREHSQPPYPPGPRAEGFLGREQPAPLPTRAESGRILGEGAVSPYPPGPRVEGLLGREQPALPTRAQSGVGSWGGSSQPYPPGPRAEWVLGKGAASPLPTRGLGIVVSSPSMAPAAKRFSCALSVQSGLSRLDS